MSRYSSIYRIPLPTQAGRLSIISRPRGNDWLDDEFVALKQDGITHVVSMLEPHEALELGLADEPNAALRSHISYTNVPVVDRSVPTNDRAFLAAAERLSVDIVGGAFVGIHCRQSVGRSSMMSIAILHRLGVSLKEATDLVRTARGLPVPETPAQEQWLSRFC